MNAQQIESIGNAAIQQLRIDKLKNGFPFMINSRELPTNTCYLEYPDGSIKLMTLIKNARNFTLIRILSEAENKQTREKFGLTIMQ